MADAVYIVGIGMTPLGKFPLRSVKDLAAEAVRKSLEDANCSERDIDAVWFSNTRQGMMEGQNVIRGQCALFPIGLSGIPIVNVENACASSSTGLREAFAHIKAGLCELALVVGAEKMFYPDQKEQMFRAFLGGTDIHLIDQTRKWLNEISLDLDHPTTQPGGLHSFFMDIYAALARRHMRLFGTTVEQLAAAASKNHKHSTMNP